MSIKTMPQTIDQSKHFSIEMLKDEVQQLLEMGKVDCSQPIYVLCQFIPAREWVGVERELERHGFLLRDHIADLNPAQCWGDD
ncbi:hypothetical protein Lepto7376_1100 [[Leptolyngbya] sp. PCC 7376]|uniref:DUF4327 family protein n=1 Tax=[Leptolyngbya] sp. PCC 7376 TaxID=111781 RepID=UPI00029EE546|nr:DUF4327 family protein [[Leptolyngbya] sp. PCC 7376]AFY37468.1 hypothetical protein Lepto7376_1100 [[Leptolyngbya] sp. PCC 7376]